MLDSKIKEELLGLLEELCDPNQPALDPAQLAAASTILQSSPEWIEVAHDALMARLLRAGHAQARNQVVNTERSTAWQLHGAPCVIAHTAQGGLASNNDSLAHLGSVMVHTADPPAGAAAG